MHATHSYGDTEQDFVYLSSELNEGSYHQHTKLGLFILQNVLGKQSLHIEIET